MAIPARWGAACSGAVVSGWFSHAGQVSWDAQGWRRVVLHIHVAAGMLDPGRGSRDAAAGHGAEPSAASQKTEPCPPLRSLPSPGSRSSDHPLFPGNLHLLPPAVSS